MDGSARCGKKRTPLKKEPRETASFASNRIRRRESGPNAPYLRGLRGQCTGEKQQKLKEEILN